MTHHEAHPESEIWAIPDAWNDLSRRVIGCAMRVHSALGPGLPERVYEDAFVHDLTQEGLAVARQVEVRLAYRGLSLSPLRLDLVVNELIVLELKSVDTVLDLHLAQLVSYLRASTLPLGLLINFNTLHLKDGIFRRINPKSPLRFAPR